MIKFWFGTNINRYYSIDIALLYKIRELSDGLTFIDFSFEWDRYKADHKPSLEAQFVLLNFVIFTVVIYRKSHCIFDDNRSILKETDEETRSRSKEAKSEREACSTQEGSGSDKQEVRQGCGDVRSYEDSSKDPIQEC